VRKKKDMQPVQGNPKSEGAGMNIEIHGEYVTAMIANLEQGK